MHSPNEILVSTTTSIEGFPVKQYLKPVTAHLVAGTNIFSDIGASLTDIFGGRSSNYQKQIIQLYHDAIEEIKLAAHELGANCILGLKIDMDEISGSGKSMFMLTVIGTAVIIEKNNLKSDSGGSTASVASLEQIEALRKKREYMEEINDSSLALNKDSWRFITENQVREAFPYVLEQYNECLKAYGLNSKEMNEFRKLTITYLSRMTSSMSIQLLYNRVIDEKDDVLRKHLIDIIKEMNLFDFDEIKKMLSDKNFNTQKNGVALSLAEKKYFNDKDLKDLEALKELIEREFPERGKRIMKKALLSSKEKEMWVCECGETNDLNTACGKCYQDIYGFKSNETKPKDAISEIEEKIELVKEALA